MAEGFDVIVSELRAGASHLVGDAGDITSAATEGNAGVSAAASGVPGGPLAASLAAFAEQLGERAGEMAGAVEGAGATLASNAATYTSGDAGVARSLDQVLQQ